MFRKWWFLALVVALVVFFGGYLLGINSANVSAIPAPTCAPLITSAPTSTSVPTVVPTVAPTVVPNVLLDSDMYPYIAKYYINGRSYVCLSIAKGTLKNISALGKQIDLRDAPQGNYLHTTGEGSMQEYCSDREDYLLFIREADTNTTVTSFPLK